MNRLLSRASQLLRDCPADRGFPEMHFHWLFEVRQLIVDFDTSSIATEIPAAWGGVRDNIKKFTENEGYRPADYTAVVLSDIYKDLVRNTDKREREITNESDEFSLKAEDSNELYTKTLEQRYTDKTLYKQKPLCKLPTDYDKSRFIPFQCRLETKNKILRSLRDHCITLIHGPGGIGKTNLLSEIAETAQKEKMFSRVVYAKVAKKLSVNAIQAEIAEQLGLSWTPGVITDEDRSTELKKEIETLAKVLVILDDVWEGFNLIEIGIPAIPPVGVKVLVGSRRSDLPFGSANKIPVETLTEEDSWSILKKEAPVVERIPRTLAEEVQAECCGLPLALAVIGKALSGKEKHDWERAADYLKNSDFSCRELKGIEGKLYTIIKYSYDHLQESKESEESEESQESEEVKLERAMNRWLFLSCCLFQESEEVHVVDLKRYLAQDVDLKAYTDGYDSEYLGMKIGVAADRLEQYGLLQNHMRTRGTVKMHDVVRDVAVNIAKRENYAFIIFGDTYLRKKNLTKYKRVSLRNIRREYAKLDSPEVDTLLIRGNTVLHDLFFEKVVTSLAMLDLSHSEISTLPPSMAKLQEVRTLLLNGCKKFTSVHVIVQLSKLSELSLRDSVVQLLPKYLVRPTVLHWEDSTPARGTHPAVTAEHVQGLRKLKEVSIASRYVTDEAFQKITEFENLQDVKLYVTNSAPSSHDNFADAKTSKWKNFTIYNHGLCPLVPHGKHLSIMDLEEVPPGVKALLKKAEEVVIDHCFHKVTMSEENPEEGAKTVLVLTQATGKGTFEETKILHLQQCPSISYITSKDGAKLTKLEEMELTSLEELIGIFEPLDNTDTDTATLFEPLEITDTDTGSLFEKVTKIAVTSCDKIICVMPNDIMQMVDKTLQVISVRNCKMVPRIFHPEADSRALLSVLGSIEIDNLEMLTCIWQGVPPQLMFKNLTEFFVRKCNKLTSLFTAHVAAQLKNLQKLTIEDNSGLTEIISADGTDTPSSVQAFQSVSHPEIIPHQETFQNLKEFNVRKCHKLTSLFTANVAEQLKSLQKFTVEDNSGLTEIVRTDGDNVAPSGQAFPSVMHLSLQKLPILNHFSSDEVNFCWPHLVKLILGACPGLARLPIVPNGAPRMIIIDLDSSDDLTWYNQLVIQDNELMRFEIWINNEKYVP